MTASVIPARTASGAFSESTHQIIATAFFKDAAEVALDSDP